MCEGVHSFLKLIWTVFKAKNLKTAALFSQTLRTAAAPTPEKPSPAQAPWWDPTDVSRLEICWPHLVSARSATKRNRPLWPLSFLPVRVECLLPPCSLVTHSSVGAWRNLGTLARARYGLGPTRTGLLNRYQNLRQHRVKIRTYLLEPG